MEHREITQGGNSKEGNKANYFDLTIFFICVTDGKLQFQIKFSGVLKRLKGSCWYTRGRCITGLGTAAAG